MKSRPSPSPKPENTLAGPENQLDDPSWLAFLQHNQPIAPPPHPDLEDLILQEINTLQISTSPHFNWRRWLALGILGTVTCGSLGLWFNNQRQFAETSHEADLAQLQNFIEQSYDGVYVSADDALK